MKVESHRQKEAAMRYLRAVRRFADGVLSQGRDAYGAYSTPLFVDGLNPRSGEPVVWRVEGQTWTLSNLASQQVLLRTLDGLSALTGESRYRQAAEEAQAYAFARLRHGRLLSWGGHMAYDLERKNSVYAPDKGPVHELKCHFPYYDLMWRVNPEQTMTYIDAMWESHITNWDNLEFSRHGRPLEQSVGHRIWERPYQHLPVFFTARGLTFINAASDLVYAAAMLHHLSGDDKPLRWAKRLQERYVEARDAKTGISGYQYSRSVLPGPGGRGDRAEHQFGEQLAAHHPTEATLLVSRQVRTIVARSSVNKLRLAERLGSAGEAFGRWASQDLLALAEYSYDVEDSSFHPILTNGLRLTNLSLDRSGYYGARGERLAPMRAGWEMLWPYLMAYRLTSDPRFLPYIHQMSRAGGLDFGQPPEETPAGVSSDPLELLCLLEWHACTEEPGWLALAVQSGEQILKERFHYGYFLPSSSHRYAKFDALEPLALLHLAANLLGRAEVVPDYPGSSAFFGSAYEDLGHKIDNQWIYGQRLLEEGGGQNRDL